MANWIPIEDGFIPADVIRWTETVYRPRHSRRGRPVRLGKRQVTAEVLGGPDRKGMVWLLARQCETVEQLTIRKLPSFMNGDEIRRAYGSILRGKPERLLWSDESAREVVAREVPKRSRKTNGANRKASKKKTPTSRRCTSRSKSPRKNHPPPRVKG